MTIAVFRSGHGGVGVVSADCLARDEHSVVGIDPDTVKLDLLSLGKGPIVQSGLEELITPAVTAGRILAGADHTAAVAHGDVLMVCVGTPGRAGSRLEVTYLRRVVQQIARVAHGSG